MRAQPRVRGWRRGAHAAPSSLPQDIRRGEGPHDTYHQGEGPLPGDDADEPGQRQLQTHAQQ